MTAWNLRRSLRQCEALIELIGTVICRIDTSRCPLREIYRDYENRELESCGFLPLLRREGMTYAAENCTGLCIGKEATSVLISLGSRLGESGKEEQLEHCRYSQTRLSCLTEEKRNGIGQKTRLCVSLCAAAGLMIDLMLW